HGLPNSAADIFEIDVDAFRAGRGKLFGKVTRAMVDGGVEAKFLGDIAAFFRAASDADGPGAGHLGELSDERADRAACSRDNNRLALLRLADELEPGIGGEAGHAKHAQSRGDGRQSRVELAQRGPIPCRMGAPTRRRQHYVAGSVART